MYTLPIKNWFTHYHIPNRHSMAIGAKHMVHDVRFWIVLIGIAVMIALIALIILTGSTGGPIQPLVFPGEPLYPVSY